MNRSSDFNCSVSVQRVKERPLRNRSYDERWRWSGITCTIYSKTNDRKLRDRRLWRAYGKFLKVENHYGMSTSTQMLPNTNDHLVKGELSTPPNYFECFGGLKKLLGHPSLVSYLTWTFEKRRAPRVQHWWRCSRCLLVLSPPVGVVNENVILAHVRWVQRHQSGLGPVRSNWRKCLLPD